MNYEYVNNNHKIIFKDEISYLDCRIYYLTNGYDLRSFESFVELIYGKRYPHTIKEIKHIQPILSFSKDMKREKQQINSRWEILDL